MTLGFNICTGLGMELQEIKEAAESGVPLRQMAKSLKMSERKLKVFLKENCIFTKFQRQQAVWQELKNDSHLIEELAQTMTVNQLAAKWEIDYQDMYRFALLNGITCQPERVSSHPATIRKACVAEISQGAAIRATADKYGLSESTVRNWVQRDAR